MSDEHNSKAMSLVEASVGVASGGQNLPDRSNALPDPDSIQLSRLFLDETVDLAKHSAAGFKILMVLVGRMKKSNSVVISNQSLGTLTGLSIATVKRAIKELRDQDWLEVGKIGTMNVYRMNSAIFWKQTPSGHKWAEFESSVVLSFDEQDEITQKRLPGQFTRHFPLVEVSDYAKNDGAAVEPQGALF